VQQQRYQLLQDSEICFLIHSSSRAQSNVNAQFLNALEIGAWMMD